MLVPYPRVVDKHWEGYLSCRGPPCGAVVPASHQNPQPRVQCQPVSAREVPITSGYENQQELMLSKIEGFWRPRHSSLFLRIFFYCYSITAVYIFQTFLLKGLPMNLLSLTHSELQHWGSFLKGNRDILRGTELSGIRARAARADKSTGQGHCPFWSPTTTELASSHHIWVSINLTLIAPLEIPWVPAPPNFQAHPSHFQ